MRAFAYLAITVATLSVGSAVAQVNLNKRPGLPASPTSCAAPPPAVRDIVSESVYRDPKRSVVDAVAVDRNARNLAALDRPLKDIIGWSSLYLAKKDAAAAGCALTWLAAWARDGAMLGSVRGEQSEGNRKWRTAGVAIAYLKLKERASPDQQASIEAWLKSLANAVVSSDTALKVINNRQYWTGLVATAVGFATNDDALQKTGRSVLADLEKNMGTDGSLLSELPRGQIAAHLHNYALAPLILSAEIAARHGQNWYGPETAPIHRVAAFVAQVNADPSAITKITGAFQKQPSSGVLGWQAFYNKRFPKLARPVKGATGPWTYSWLGGDLTGLANAWVK